MWLEWLGKEFIKRKSNDKCVKHKCNPAQCPQWLQILSVLDRAMAAVLHSCICLEQNKERSQVQSQTSRTDNVDDRRDRNYFLC